MKAKEQLQNALSSGASPSTAHPNVYWIALSLMAVAEAIDGLAQTIEDRLCAIDDTLIAISNRMPGDTQKGEDHA